MAAIRTIPFMLTAVLALAGVARRARREAQVGTEVRPFTFQDANGRLTGYDVEAVRADRAARRLERLLRRPGTASFSAFESRKYDLVANQIGKTPEREKKYLFTDDYLVSGAQIIVKVIAGTFTALESSRA